MRFPSSLYFQQIHIVDYKLIFRRSERVEVNFLKTGVILDVFKESGKLEVSTD